MSYATGPVEERVPVRFLRNHPPYYAGEVAGFAPDYSAKLVDTGVAEAYAPEKKTAEATAEPEAEPPAVEAESAAPVERRGPGRPRTTG